MRTVLLFLMTCPLVGAFAQMPKAAGLEEIASFYRGPRAKKPDPSLKLDDRLFIRRIFLDLTGRLPDPERVELFMSNTSTAKRAALVEEIIGSEAFVDRWTYFFEDLFSTHVLIGGIYRNPFHFTLRQMVADGRPWNEMASRLIMETGVGSREDSLFSFWGLGAFLSEFRLDFLDDQISLITKSMLGMSTSCISCHDGAYHLEDINKGLSTMTRRQFWGMAAFLSSSYAYIPRSDYDLGSEEGILELYRELMYVDTDDADFNKGEGFYFLSDERFDDGNYHAQSEPGEGMRAPRNGGVVEPAWMTTGEGPQTGETRRAALARILTGDRQFALNMVNRLWAHFFGEGFVEPLTGWDLGRLDTETALTHGSTVQSRNVVLMEYLTDFFIDSNYDLRALMRVLTNSWLYQINYANAGKGGTNGLDYWVSNRRVRRLEPEAINDAIFDLLETGHRYVITGIHDRTFDSAWQLPDNYEPNPGALSNREGGFVVEPESLGFPSEEAYYYYQFSALSLLERFGRGDRYSQVLADTESTVQTALSMMNWEMIHTWVLGENTSPFLQRLIEDYENQRQTETELTQTLFRRFLWRDPNPLEVDIFASYFKDKEAEQGIPDMVWSLLNHVDFLYK